MSPGRNVHASEKRVHNHSFRELFFTCVVVILGWQLPTPVLAGPIQAALRKLAEAVSRQADDASQRLAKMLEQLETHSDEALEQAGKGLRGATPTDEAIEALAKAGIREPEQLRVALDAMNDSVRGALVGLLEESNSLLKRWARLGNSADELLEAVQKGGPDVLYACRQMTSDGGLRTVVRGTREFGPDFVSFVRKGDENAVRSISDHLDELRRAWDDPTERPRIEDLFNNPEKYFDELGRATRDFDELIASIRRGHRPGVIRRTGDWFTNFGKRIGGFLLRTVAPIWAFAGAIAGFLAAAIAILLPCAGGGVVKGALQFFLLLSLLCLVGLRAFSGLLGILNRILWRALESLSRRQGRVGDWARKRVERRQPARCPRFYVPRFRRTAVPILRIGILGVRRVGKTTFTVMLTKHLHRAVSGAWLRPHRDDPDSAVLHEMEEEVRHCRPTRQQYELALDLTWPFFWTDPDRPSANFGAASPTEPDGSNSPESQLAGKLDVRLELADYPGEWASQPDGRDRLSGSLKEVDGLLVVIDPTDLENGKSEDRLRLQGEAIQNMFAADRLDLGGSFLRSLAIVLTKRDSWTPELLYRITGGRGRESGGDVQQMAQLAQRPEVTDEESRRLGEWLFGLLYPGQLEALRTRLAESIRPRRAWYQRLAPWFTLNTRPQLRIFAVSQLGKDLGEQVARYRRRLQKWQASGGQGPKPSVRLDLESANPRELDIVRAFCWILNSIPEGWMWTAQRLPRGFAWYLPFVWRWFSPAGRVLAQTKQRFEGAPCVRRNSRVLRRRARVALLAGIVLLGAVSVFAAAKWKSREVWQLRNLIGSAQAEVVEWRTASRTTTMRIQRWMGGVWVAQDYVPHANFALALLQFFQDVGPLERTVLSTDKPLADKCTDAVQWLTKCSQLNAPPVFRLVELQNLFDTVGKRRAAICTRLIADLRNERGRLVTQEQYTTAYKEIDLVKNTLRVLPPDETGTYLEEIDELEKQTARAHAAYLWSAACREAKNSLQQNNYTAAVQALKFCVWPDRLVAEDRREFDHWKKTRLDQIAKEWFESLNQQVEMLLRDRQVDKVYPLVQEFRRIVTWDNWPSKLKDLEDSTCPRFVQLSLQAARKMVAEGNFKDADSLLEDCLPYLPECSTDTRREWYRCRAELIRGQQKWQELVEHLLGIPAAVRESDWDQACEVAWRQWTEDFEDRLNLPQPDLDTLESELRWARTRTNSMPADILVKLPKWEVALLERKLDLALQKADQLAKEAKFSEAHRELDQFGPDLLKLSSRSLKRWFEYKLYLLEKEQRYLSAIDWFESYEGPIHQRLSEANFDWPDRRTTLISRAVHYSCERFAELLKRDAQSAFAYLYEECHGLKRPREYQEQLSKYAEELVSSHIASCEDKVDELLGHKRYEQAQQATEDLETELGPWLLLSARRTRIDALKDKIIHRQIEDELRQIADDIDQDRCNFKGVCDRLQGLIHRHDLADDQRARANQLRDRLLERWEQEDYEALRKALANCEFQQLERVLERYTGKDTPYLEKIPANRRAAANVLRNWLDQFDRLTTYQIVGFTFGGVPRGGLSDLFDWDFDFAFQLKIGSRTYNVTGAYEVEGNGSNSFSKAVSVQWASGTPLSIYIWDDELGKRGHYVGRIVSVDKYALVRLCLMMQQIDVTGTDYADYNWHKARIRLDCPQIGEPPELPP